MLLCLHNRSSRANLLKTNEAEKVQKPTGQYWNRREATKKFLVYLLFHQNKYVTDFKKKIELFNFFFAKQCSIINNSSELPFNLCKKVDKPILAVTFTTNDIATLTQSFDPNKTHGHMLSICMLKLCGKSICKLLDLYFNLYNHGEFPTELKKSNVAPVHKKVTTRF